MEKVIFIAPDFQDLNKVILKSIKKKYDVVFIKDRLLNNSFYKSIIRLKPNLFSSLYKQYLYLKLRKYEKYDYLFVINGEDLTNNIIEQLKVKYKIKKSYFYLWDSIRQKKNAINILNNFDYKFSYQDEKKIKIKKLELFYIPQSKISIKNKFKFFFVGTVYTNRERLISEIIKHNQMKENYIYYFFQAKWYYWLKKITLKTKIEYKNANFKSLKLTEFIKKLNQSEIIIDINHFNNNGISQRGMQSLYLNKKIITNNPELLNYSKNIFLINNNINDVQLKKFINKKIYKQKYIGLNTDEWLDTIINN